MAERKRKPRKAAAKVAPPTSPQPAENSGPSAEGIPGMLASAVQERTAEWLWFPWFPRAMLSLVVGTPSVGKSTFIAALIAHATGARLIEDHVRSKSSRVVFLPGQEEDLEVMTRPRLTAAGVDPDKVLILPRASIFLIRDKAALGRTVKNFGATLLIGDPIDSYVDEGLHEDRGQDIRPLLEAAAWIGKETGAAVVFARHPGKDSGNIMPGSRQWRAVPRSIVQLSSDGNVPPSFLLSHYKDSLGTGSVPCHYALDRTRGGAPRFVLGDAVDRSAEELQKSATGPTGRYKLMNACRLIRWLFQEDGSPTRQQLGDEGRKQGLGEDTINDALRLLGVKSVPPDERGSPWRLVRIVEEWPAWLPTVTPTGGGPE